jgi:hypothetical protein
MAAAAGAAGAAAAAAQEGKGGHTGNPVIKRKKWEGGNGSGRGRSAREAGSEVGGFLTSDPILVNHGTVEEWN